MSVQKVRFDQICKNISNRIDDPKQADTDYYVGLEHLDSEEPRILRHGSPNDVNATKLKFKSGQILFGKRRWYQRKLAVAEREGICSAHMMVLEHIEDFITKDFLPILMQSEDFFEKAISVSAGSLSPTIKWKDIAKEEFLIPSIHEQLSAISLISQIDDSISNTQNLLEKFKNYFISRREDLLTKGIGHTKFKKVKVVNDEIIKIPEEWEIKRLEDIANVKGRIGWRGYTQKDFVAEGLGVLSLGAINIKNSQLDLTNRTYVTVEKYDESPEIQVTANDIIIQKTGSIGGIALIEQDIGKATINPNISLIKKINCDSKFLSYLLMGVFIKKQIRRFTTATSVPLLTQENIRSLIICLPSLAEQKQIISILLNMDEQITHQQSHLSNLKILRKSILNSKLTKEKKIVIN